MGMQMEQIDWSFHIMSEERTKRDKHIYVFFEVCSIVTGQIVKHLLGGNRMSNVSNFGYH